MLFIGRKKGASWEEAWRECQTGEGGAEAGAAGTVPEQEAAASRHQEHWTEDDKITRSEFSEDMLRFL